ncbi:hypothetical protein AX14_000461 [Amanita brunnescens Koide BX004]|nr:hypothetical protein AX14_000461 [Amanita brunnescens Koide BX004]
MLARTIVARRIPQMLSVRHNSGSYAGSVAQSQGFGRKEKAHEDEFVHRQELAKLQKMKEEIARKQQELDSLQKEHEELQSNVKSS